MDQSDQAFRPSQPSAWRLRVIRCRMAMLRMLIPTLWVVAVVVIPIPPAMPILRAYGRWLMSSMARLEADVRNIAECDS